MARGKRAPWFASQFTSGSDPSILQTRFSQARRLDSKVSVIASASEAIQGNIRRPSTSGSPRRFAPRDDEFHSSAPSSGRPSHAHPRHQSQHHALDDAEDRGRRQGRSLAWRRSHHGQSRLWASQHRGLFRRGVLRSRPDRGDRQGARRGRLRHRLFRRHRARGGAMRDACASHWHRRGRVPHGEPHRGEIQRRNDAVPIDCSDRAQPWRNTGFSPVAPACAQPRFRCWRSKSQAQTRGASSNGRSSGRSRKTAPKRSCSAAPA